MASGDQTACAQIVELLGEIETAVVKQATGRFSAECLPPVVTQEMIAQAATQAIKRLLDGDVPEPFAMDTPVQVTVEFFSSEKADRASKIPSTRREGTKVSFVGEEMLSAYLGFRSMVAMAAG
jgi:D-amino peptidase